MLNFKGTVTFLGVKETPWTNPDTNQSFTISDVICFSNTGFKSGPQSYVYHLKLNRDTKELLPQIKAWPKGTLVSIAGLVTSVDKPGKNDPTKMWTQVGLLVSEISPAMETVPPPVVEQPVAAQPEAVVMQDNALPDVGLDSIPFAPIEEFLG